MAINYQLELEAGLGTQALLTRIAKVTGMALVYENTLRDEETHLVISVHRVQDKYCADETETDFGFRPETRVSFTHGKIEYEKNNLLMMLTVATLLKEVKGNAVLIFSESPSAVLQKKDNVVTVDPSWKDKPGLGILEENGIPYKLEELIEL